MRKLKFSDDPTAQELFELVGRALADPGDAEPRRAFWKLVDVRSDHPWVGQFEAGGSRIPSPRSGSR